MADSRTDRRRYGERTWLWVGANAFLSIIDMFTGLDSGPPWWWLSVRIAVSVFFTYYLIRWLIEVVRDRRRRGRPARKSAAER